MADPAIVLYVNGRGYAGFESIRITRSIESLSGSLALGVSDRWGDDEEPWPIFEGDECRVEMYGEKVIDGYVDDVELGGSDRSRTLTITGRDRAEDVVDCSVLIPDASTKGSKWTYRNVDIFQFATQICAPHGVKVSVQPGLVLKKDPLLVAHPGETGFEAIKRAAGSAGVLVISDGKGGLVITRAGAGFAEGLVEGVNIKTWRAKRSSGDRFARYLISSQPPGTDEASGEATRVQAEASDAEVKRRNRVLLIRPEKGYDKAGAKARAGWEARIRAAKSSGGTFGVRGWRQVSNGSLWPINAITPVTSPRLARINEEMLISQVDFSLDASGEVTQLTVVRPDAFQPEPQIVAAAGGGWPELAKGGL